MVFMGYTEEEKKEEFTQTKSLLEDTPQYPYGLEITLRPEDVKKIGMGECNVGDKKKLMIEVEVKAVRKEETYQGVADGNVVELQITDMEVKRSEAEKEETTVNSFYG